jgi:ABC-type lipoprotein release transport system permease subunit
MAAGRAVVRPRSARWNVAAESRSSGGRRGCALRLGLVGLGIGAGVPAALLAAGALRSLLFEVTPHDVSVFAAIPMLLLGVAVLACAVPAARAARIDAAVALRDE